MTAAHREHLIISYAMHAPPRISPCLYCRCFFEYKITPCHWKHMPILDAAVADVTAGKAAGRKSRQISGVSGSRQLLAVLVLSGPGASSEAHERSDRMRAATAFAARFRPVNSRRWKTSRLPAMRPAFRKIAAMRARSMKWRSGKMRCLNGYPRRPSKRNGLVNRNADSAFASRIIEELDGGGGISRYERTMSEGPLLSKPCAASLRIAVCRSTCIATNPTTPCPVISRPWPSGRFVSDCRDVRARRPPA